MALREILEFPDPRLRTKAKPVAVVDEHIRQLADDMLETMYAAPGIGLAATQINVHLRVVVIDVSEDKNQPLVLINPSFEVLDPTLLDFEEGCLSVPGFYDSVRRPQHIRVSHLDRDGQPQTFEAQGLLAVCVQHECDHLEGRLYVDHLSPLKRQRIRSKLEKAQRARA